jgi:hypothetical protein
VGGPTAQHPPEALNHVELGTLTRQPVQAQVRIGRQDLLHARPAMPRGVINGDHDLGKRPGWIHASRGPEMGDKGGLEPLLFAVLGLGCAVCWLLQQAGGQLASHEVQRRKTIDQILINQWC